MTVGYHVDVIEKSFYRNSGAEGGRKELQEQRALLQGLFEYIQSAYDERDLGRVETVVEQIVGDLDSFSPLSHFDIAKEFIKHGLTWAVVRYIQSFDLDHKAHEVIAKEVVAVDEDSMLPEYIQHFAIDHADIAKELIAAKQGERVAEYIQNFSEECHDEIAQHFIGAGRVDLVKKYFNNFKNLSDAVKEVLEGESD